MRGLSRYLIPSLADVVFIAVFCALLATGENLLVDCDTGYHVRAGEHMLASGTVPRHDIFSSITPAPRWIAFEWLSQVALALSHRWHGLTGVVALTALVLALFAYLLFRLIRLGNGNLFVAVLVLLLTVATSALHWLARPHIFSLLLFIVWYGMLERSRSQGTRRPLLWLPISMLVWVNLHGAFIVGLGLIGAYLVGALVRYLGSPLDARGPLWPPVRVLGITLLACCAAALVNPNGADALVHPFTLLSNSFTMDHIGEFRSPDFHSLTVAPFGLTLLLLIALLARSDRKPRAEQVVLLLSFFWLALSSQRHIPLFAVVAAPVIAEQLDLLIARHRGRRITALLCARSDGLAAIDGAARGFLWIVVATAAAIWWLDQSGLRYRFDEKTKPVAAARFLHDEPPAGNGFNEYEFGDFLIYSNWPGLRVFIDGRADMYGDAYLQEYYRIRRLQPGWEALLEQHRIDWVIFDASSALSQALLIHPSWHLVHGDQVANIFVRATAANRALIERHRGVEPAARDDDAAVE